MHQTDGAGCVLSTVGIVGAMILLARVFTDSGAACAAFDGVNTAAEQNDVKTSAGTVAMTSNTRFIRDSFLSWRRDHEMLWCA